MNAQQAQKIVDALKRFPAQKSGFVKITFGANGAYVDTDLLNDEQEKEIMKHLSAKQKLLN